MRQYSSKKWTLFVTRPISLLQRSFRAAAYLDISQISDLKINQILIIGQKDGLETFVVSKEDRKNLALVVRDYQKNEIRKKFRQFQKNCRRSQFKKLDPIDNALLVHQRIGPFLVYFHYLGRIMEANWKKPARGSAKKYLNRLIGSSSRFRDLGIKMLDASYHKALAFLNKKYRSQDIEYAVIQELAGPRKFPKSEIQKRKNFFVALLNKRNNQILTGQTSRKFLKKEGFFKQRIRMEKEIKGFIASMGPKVRGRVLLVKNVKALKKIKKLNDKVIVSPMTIVQFNPYLKKVRAIVTDEGAINCHAAIISRELGIPCVIGTKIATKVLRDGQVVEVDTAKGIVKVIK